jgi:hypothetical protein
MLSPCQTMLQLIACDAHIVRVRRAVGCGSEKHKSANAFTRS